MLCFLINIGKLTFGNLNNYTSHPYMHVLTSHIININLSVEKGHVIEGPGARDMYLPLTNMDGFITAYSGLVQNENHFSISARCHIADICIYIVHYVPYILHTIIPQNSTGDCRSHFEKLFSRVPSFPSIPLR